MTRLKREMLALDPTSDVIYPGAMLKGETIPTGEYVPIVTDRSKITLSVSLTNISGSPVVIIDNPKLSSVREGIKRILDQEVTGATPARINFEITQVYSQEQLNLALGANYRSAATKVSSSFNFEQSTFSNKFVLKYLQVYYTIDMDLPAEPSDLFKRLPDINSLGSTAPVFVSTVTYGRMILYTIESNYSKTEIDAAFSASFASGGGTIDAEYQKIISESSIKALVIGGSGEDAAQVVNGPEDVYNYISNGGNYSSNSPGAPLSYKLRYLKEGTPVARVVLASEYFIRSCDLAYPVFEIEISAFRCTGCQDGDGSAAELFGSIVAQAVKDDNFIGPQARWRYTRSNIFSIARNQTRSVNISRQVEMYRPDYAIDHVKFSGSLDERDAGGAFDPDDDLGSARGQILLKDIGFQPVIRTLSFKGQVGVDFTFKRLK